MTDVKNTLDFLKDQVEAGILSKNGLSIPEISFIRYKINKILNLLENYEKNPVFIKNKIMDEIEDKAWNNGKPQN